jgi:threonine/homoserine/homoserine lactone efflux protein
MTVHTWLAFVAVAFAVSLLPGPAVVAVVSSALRGGFRASLAANAGVLVGDGFFVAAAAGGLGALLVASYALFVVIRWIGVAYLAYLGLRALVARESAVSGALPSTRRAFRLGLSTQLANPKILLFFGALLPQFVDARFAAAPQFLILGATFIASDFLVFSGYGAIAHRARRMLSSPKAAQRTSRATGVVMLGLAARLATQR